MSRKKSFSAFSDALTDALIKSITVNLTDNENWLIAELIISSKSVKFRYQDRSMDYIGRVPGACINAIFLLVKEYEVKTEFKLRATNTFEPNAWDFSFVSEKEITRIHI